MHRVRDLRDGRKIVLADRVFEFLIWASKLFEISVCSLGDQSYVDMVVQVLNAEDNSIRVGASYSARGEFLWLEALKIKKPPKDLKALFAYYDAQDIVDVIAIEPIILDDNAGMWAANQQDNIIVSLFEYN